MQIAPGGPSFGFLWDDGAFRVMQPVQAYDTSPTLGINGLRQVTGWSKRLDTPSDWRGYLWQHGVTYDLNDLALASDGYPLITGGVAINDHGQILADAGTHLLLLTPVGRPAGDLDLDCTVGITDFLKLLAEWGRPDSPADLNGDGTVDLLDFSILIDNWG
jgi:hypothetical protein